MWSFLVPRRLSSCFSNLTNLFLSFKFWWDTQKCTSSTWRLAANHLPFHSPARLADISSDPTDSRAVLLSVSFNWSYPLNNLHTNISLELLSNDIVLNALNTVDKAFSYIYRWLQVISWKQTGSLRCQVKIYKSPSLWKCLAEN